MSASHTLQKVLTITTFVALLIGSFAYAFTCAPAIIQVDLTHVGDRPEPRDVLGGRAPDYSVQVHYAHDQAPEESLILEDQYAAKTLSLSLPGESPAKWVTAIEILEHDGPLRDQVALVQPLPTDTHELEVSGYHIRWIEEHRIDAALRGFWRTPAGIVFLLVLVLLAIRIVYTFG